MECEEPEEDKPEDKKVSVESFDNLIKNADEAEEIRDYLREKGVKFDARLGLKKLKLLKQKHENTGT